MKGKELRKLEFPDSGKVVYLPAVSMAVIAMKLKRKYPMQSPPMQTVDYGDGRKTREYNYAHPDYRESQKAWQEFINGTAGDTAYARATTFTLTAEQQAEVDEWKAANAGGYDDGDSDKDLWLEEIAIATDADFQVLLEFIGTAGQPAEEVVKSIQDSFPGDVSGQGHLEGPHT